MMLTHGVSSASAHLVRFGIRTKLANYGYSLQTELLPADRSIICVSTHACSLDAWIAFDLTYRALRRRFMQLGDTTILSRFPMLHRFGSLPVSAADPMLTMRSLSAAGKALRTNRNVALWLFPTGHHVPSGSGIGTIRPGLQALGRFAGDSVIVPVGFHYYAYHRPRLAVWVHIGSPIGTAREIACASWQTVARDTSEALARTAQEAVTQVRRHVDEQYADPR